MVSRFTQIKFVSYPILNPLEQHSFICGETNLRRLLVICGTTVHNNKKKSEQLWLVKSINQDQKGPNCELKMIHQ